MALHFQVDQPVGPPRAKNRPTRFTQTQLDKQRSQLIMSFYRGFKLFRDSFDADGKSHMSYHRMDYLIETYFRTVKDLSHHLFRDSEKSRFAKMLQITFDMSFGIVFHSLLKCKETLRLAERYKIDRLGQTVDRLQKSGDPGIASASALFQVLREGYERDLKSLDEELARTDLVFEELEVVFSKIISIYNDNATILRSLYAGHDFFLRLFPGEGVDRVFRHMFPETGAGDAYVVLGFDFLRSGHVRLAERAFRRAARGRAKDGDGIGERYRLRRALFIGGDPEHDPEAAERQAQVEGFEAEHELALFLA